MALLDTHRGILANGTILNTRDTMALLDTHRGILANHANGAYIADLLGDLPRQHLPLFVLHHQGQ